MTDADRQKRLVARRKAQGLALKRVWVPPSAWPAIKDLATQEAEEFVFSECYASTTQSENETAYAYELARGLWAEIRLQAVAKDDGNPHGFCLKVLRAMIKTTPEPFIVTAEEVSAARRIVHEEDDADED